jgi:hypothetical protein
VLAALDAASSPSGLGISARRITISTVGLPEAMDRLTRTGPRYHLAVSLHAPNDALRNELVPVNRRIGLDRVIAAADRYFAASGRRLTFEYVLLADINDRPEHARQLAALLRGRPALLNVIPYNPVPGLPYRTPSTAAIEQFRQILERAGPLVVNVPAAKRRRDRRRLRPTSACIETQIRIRGRFSLNGQLARDRIGRLTPVAAPGKHQQQREGRPPEQAGCEKIGPSRLLIFQGFRRFRSEPVPTFLQPRREGIDIPRFRWFSSSWDFREGICASRCFPFLFR